METVWKTIERFEDMDQAIYHREMLENAGILVALTEDDVPGPESSEVLPGASGNVCLQVPDEQALDAASVLEEESARLMRGNA